MTEQTMTTAVVVQKDGFLVSAEVAVAEYVRATSSLLTRRLSVMSFHPLAVVTGVGFSWVQPESPAAHELKGLTVMPTFERLHQGDTLVIDRALYQRAVTYFMQTDPAHLTRQARSLVIEVTTGHGPTLLNLKADFQESDEDGERPFLLTGVVPAGRLVTAT
ncbi:hypothetical protein [Deinococcus sp.]|uniref:hypothetical protein n=1 Tax=Deinococcus sp. TaxID=47478 RepID=UPI003C7BD3CA